jgi:hypothetical protein
MVNLSWIEEGFLWISPLFRFDFKAVPINRDRTPGRKRLRGPNRVLRQLVECASPLALIIHPPKECSRHGELSLDQWLVWIEISKGLGCDV